MYTWIADGGKRIVCDSVGAFHEIRRKYFPDVPIESWIRQ